MSYIVLNKVWMSYLLDLTMCGCPKNHCTPALLACYTVQIIFALILFSSILQNDMSMKRTVFIISDGTGITAETLGNSLLTQFEQVEFETVTLPYLDTMVKARAAVQQINDTCVHDQNTPLIFGTLVNRDIRNLIGNSQGLLLDFFETFIGPLEQELQAKSSYTIGRSHSAQDNKTYDARIKAINFALQTDDGVNTHQYEQAELILTGVSRSGKTPTSLYLALQYGLCVANYPITEDDLERSSLPKLLLKHSQKLFGLTIDPIRLRAIRNQRRPESRYASLKQCQHELKSVEAMLNAANISHINTTTLSIEEISTKILVKLGINRRLL